MACFVDAVGVDRIILRSLIKSNEKRKNRTLRTFHTRGLTAPETTAAINVPV